MTIPSFALGLVCACFMGTLFHVVVDGGGGRLALCLVLSAFGFVAGNWLAASQGWSFVPVGPIELGFAVLGSVLFLVLGHWLSQIRIETGDKDGTV